MTTSSDHRTPSGLPPHGDHWLELTAMLCRKSTSDFGDWLSDELTMLEEELDSYVTPRSLGKSLRRSSHAPDKQDKVG